MKPLRQGGEWEADGILSSIVRFGMCTSVSVTERVNAIAGCFNVDVNSNGLVWQNCNIQIDEQSKNSSMSI